ncbi:MAG: molybdopterin-dependent oxidoreductase [Desulfobacteraceae bacterium]|nr:molybdopterin-dependent oxidoreductase [Desulfobacteraceae bacterium]
MRKHTKAISRRKFLVQTGGIVAGIGLPGVFKTLSHAETQAIREQLRPDGKPRIPPGQTAVKQIRDMGGTPPDTPISDWRLVVYGDVAQPLALSLDALLGLGVVGLTCDIHCVTGWTLLDSRWSGIRLGTLIEKAKPVSSAKFVSFETAGYSANIPMVEAVKENVLLAHEYAGSPLPGRHGFPLRALVPDRYLYKSTKWVEKIKITTIDEPGYWETRGYSNSADPWTEDRYDQEYTIKPADGEQQ